MNFESVEFLFKAKMTFKCLLILVLVLIVSGANGSEFFSNITAVVPGDKCVIQMDCATLINSYCSKDKKCTCGDGYVARYNRCVPRIGTKCKVYSDDCKLDNTTCDNGTCQCHYKFIAVSETECVEVVNHGDECQYDSQCSCKNSGTCNTEEPYADILCLGNKCTCYQGYHYVSSQNTCVKTAQKLGDNCTIDDSCLLLKNTKCINNQCSCPDKHFLEQGQCVSGVGGTCSIKDDCKANNTRCGFFGCECEYKFVELSVKQCVPASNYGDECQYDSQCSCKKYGTCNTEEPYADVLCLENKCSCYQGYHYVSSKNTCVKTAQKLGDNCTINDNCLLIKKTKCIDNQCSCPDKHFLEQDQCVSGVDGTCSINEDCKANNTRCGFFGCECEYKFVELSVKQCVPVKNYGEDCLIDEQCSCDNNGRCYLDTTYENLICSKKNKTCSCSDGFHYISERDSCVRSAKVIDDPCKKNDNCLLLSDTECKQGKCQCVKNYFNSDGQCKKGLNSLCAQNNHCSAVPNSRCIENKCQCNDKYIPISTGVCAAITNYGEPCQFQEQCQNNGTIVVPYEELVCNGTCSCSEGFHYVENRRACVESSTAVGGNCSVNDHCGRLPNTRCWNDQCSCLEYYYQRGEQCVPGIGAQCSGNCEVTNSICSSTGRCICAPGNIFAAQDRCVPITGMGNDCEIDEQCSCLYQKCDLKQPNRDLVCSAGTCSCPTEYHYNFRLKFCIHTATVGEQCSTNENCEKLLFAECVNQRCECKPNYFASEGKCRTGLNANCITTNQCSAVEHAECRNGKCQCVEQFVERSTGLCVPVSSFGQECEYVEQCTQYISNATCEATTDGDKKVCRCGTGQHHHATGCFQTKILDEQCDSNSECFVTSKYDSAACIENKCVCVEGFEKINGTYCDGAGSILASALLIVFMVVFKFTV